MTGVSEMVELAERVAKLERENERLQRLVNNNRAALKRKGRDLLREEADGTLPAFLDEWEPLRDIANRAGAQSAAWLASRARDLQRRGLVESRWLGSDRTASMKVWRRGPGRLAPITTCGQTPLRASGGQHD